MSVVVAPSVLMNERDFNVNSPIILYDNLVSASNVTADSADSNYPTTNLGNPATFLEWRSASTAEQLLTITNAEDRLCDTIGIARHNFGTAQIAVSVEGNNGSGYVTLTDPVMFADDAPKLFRFTKDVYVGLRLRLAAGTDEPRLAVLYAGEALILQRRIYVGHTPITLGRQRKVITGRSESGNYMGRIVTGGQSSSAVSLQNLDPGWYRSKFDPFVEAAEETPFFFSWRPATYPREIGFVWLTQDPIPKNQRANGMMQVDLQFTGIIA